MAEHEKELLEKIAEAIPKLSEYEKGYINGVADNAVEKSKAEEKTEKGGGINEVCKTFYEFFRITKGGHSGSNAIENL